MKIIDLLNKIANGEEVPKIVKYNDFIYIYDKDICDYSSDDLYLFDNTYRLNDEVKIIEGKEEKKIPEKLYDIVNLKEGICKAPSNEQLMHKINEIIDYLKSKGE